jgi:4-amino-4-deoxy-L-arabinose transferase-like glycosyltransferase
MTLPGHMKRTANVSGQLVYRLTLEDIYCDNSHSWERNMFHIRAYKEQFNLCNEHTNAHWYNRLDHMLCYNITYYCSIVQGWAKVGLQLWVRETQNLFLYYYYYLLLYYLFVLFVLLLLLLLFRILTYDLSILAILIIITCIFSIRATANLLLLTPVLPLYTRMRRITTFRSTTDRIYDGCPIIL